MGNRRNNESTKGVVATTVCSWGGSHPTTWEDRERMYAILGLKYVLHDEIFCVAISLFLFYKTQKKGSISFDRVVSLYTGALEMQRPYIVFLKPALGIILRYSLAYTLAPKKSLNSLPTHSQILFSFVRTIPSPPPLNSLSKLVSLELRENLLKNLPESISQLTKLERLDLGDNEIDELPSHVGYLPSLQELWLDHNQLLRLPPEIGLLKKLVCLDVSENRLEELPEEIGGLECLTDLHLSQNLLETLPNGISKLTNLSILKLDQNRLHTLNDSIGCCVHMQELILTENFLSELPATVGNMLVLNNLNVDRNSLVAVPSELGNCRQLGVLSLRENKLTRLPAELGNCGELHVLDVSGNLLQHLPYSLVNLQLKAVWLSENQSQPVPTFQPDVDETTNEQVLTCFLLPQQRYVPSNPSQREDTDSENWEEREASRTHSVKFTEDFGADRDTPFVRQNTPHPKELKMKAHKLFAKERKSDDLSGNLDTLSEESASRPSLLNRSGYGTATMEDIQGHAIPHDEEQGEAAAGSAEAGGGIEGAQDDEDGYEKRVGFEVNEDEDDDPERQQYGEDGDEHGGKKPISKLHRRYTVVFFFSFGFATQNSY